MCEQNDSTLTFQEGALGIVPYSKMELWSQPMVERGEKVTDGTALHARLATVVDATSTT